MSTISVGEGSFVIGVRENGRHGRIVLGRVMMAQDDWIAPFGPLIHLMPLLLIAGMTVPALAGSATISRATVNRPEYAPRVCR